VKTYVKELEKRTRLSFTDFIFLPGTWTRVDLFSWVTLLEDIVIENGRKSSSYVPGPIGFVLTSGTQILEYTSAIDETGVILRQKNQRADTKSRLL